MSKLPNIIFVLTDDQGYWALGCNGNPEIRTPHIDALAQNGARFENFFCTSPVCSPARASLLTGRIPSQHGVHDWIRGGCTAPGAIQYLDGMRSYTEDLVDLGYRCALSGKWHLGDSATPQKGYDKNLWYTHQRGGGPYYGAPMVKNGELIEEKQYVTDAITDNALEFMDELARAEQPFYLGVHYTAPHSPWTDGNHPKELTDLYKDCAFSSCPVEAPHPDAIYHIELDVPTVQDEARERLTGYFAAVSGVDNSVGRLVQRLKELGIYENTLLIFSADNGFNCGHHGIWGKGNGTFPFNMYDTSVKVPFIMQHPARIRPGQVVTELTSGYDFMPTLLDYVGIQQPEREELAGKSFLPALEGNPTDASRPVVIFDEYGPVRMIRTYHDKYICRYPYGPDEYYDLTADPDEKTNRIQDPSCSPRVTALKKQMEEWFLQYTDPKVDGRVQHVCGNGQLTRSGIYANGEKCFTEQGHSYTVEV